MYNLQGLIILSLFIFFGGSEFHARETRHRNWCTLWMMWQVIYFISRRTGVRWIVGRNKLHRGLCNWRYVQCITYIGSWTRHVHHCPWTNTCKPKCGGAFWIFNFEAHCGMHTYTHTHMYTLFQCPRIKLLGSQEFYTAAYSQYITRVDIPWKDFSEI